VTDRRRLTNDVHPTGAASQSPAADGRSEWPPIHGPAICSSLRHVTRDTISTHHSLSGREPADRRRAAEQLSTMESGGLSVSTQVMAGETGRLSDVLTRQQQQQQQQRRENRGRRLYIFKVFIEYPLDLGSGCISMFSVNLTFDKTLVMQFCYLFFLQKIATFATFFSAKNRHFCAVSV